MSRTLFALFITLGWLNATTVLAQVATAKEAVLEERYPQPEVKFAGGVSGLI